MDTIMLVLAVAVVGYGVSALWLRGVVAQPLLIHFAASEQISLKPSERRVLFHEAARQQKLAFALLATAITLGFVLGTLLIGRFITATAIDVKTVAAAVTTAGDITLAMGAWRLYKTTCKRLDDIADRIG